MARFLTKTGPELLEPTRIVYEIDCQYGKDISNRSGAIRTILIPLDHKKAIIEYLKRGFMVILKFINHQKSPVYYMFFCAILSDPSYCESIINLGGYSQIENFQFCGDSFGFSNAILIDKNGDDPYDFFVDFAGIGEPFPFVPKGG